MTENINKNIDTQGEKRPPFITVSMKLDKNGIRKTHLYETRRTISHLVWQQNLEYNSAFEPNIFGRVVKTAINMSGGKFCSKKHFFGKTHFHDVFRH